MQNINEIEELIKLISKSRGFTAIIIGDGEEKKYYKGLVKKYNVQDKVFFIGKIPYLDLFQYTLACDIGWLVIKGHGISNQLALPNKLFEYGLAGIPTIASDFSEMKDYILKFKLGKAVAPNNISEHINAVNKLLKWSNSKVLIENVKNNCSWHSQEQKFIELLN